RTVKAVRKRRRFSISPSILVRTITRKNLRAAARMSRPDGAMIPADLGDTLPPGAPLGDGLPRRLDADPWRPCKQTCDNQTQSTERVARNEEKTRGGPNRGGSRFHDPPFQSPVGKPVGPACSIAITVPAGRRRPTLWLPSPAITVGCRDR